MLTIPGVMRARRALAITTMLAAAVTLTACLSTPTPTPMPTAVPSPTRTPLPTLTAATTGVTAAATTETTPTLTKTVTPVATAAPVAQATPTVNPNIDPLTGITLSDPSVLLLRPLHICIDNDTPSRPQYGLDRADVVYEYLMERFFNTRFTAVFWGQEADHIGPIRSARLVNTELTPQYDAMLVCSGASDPVRWLLVTDKRFFNYGYLDIGLSDPNLKYFTVYGKNTVVNTLLIETSTASIHQYLKDTNQEKTVKVPGFTFSPSPPTTPAPAPAETISLPFPAECCAVQWTYDATTQRYLRIMNGAPHLDGTTKQQLSAANVIVLYAPYVESDIDEGYGAMGWQIGLRGEGKVTVFRDGVAIAGTWQRKELTDFMQLVDANGHAIPLHPGNSWIEIVPDSNFEVTVQ
jgi:hypothetical protein